MAAVESLNKKSLDTNDNGRPPDKQQTSEVGGASYSEKVKVGVKKCERLKRNVLEINLEYEIDIRPKLEKK